MTYDLLIAFCLFAFVTSITPGPNNLMLLASGTNFGFRRTVPHMLGVGIGFVFMVIALGLGVGKIFDLYPQSHFIFNIVATLYMFFLAYKIATSAPKFDTAESTSAPMTFLQAAAFQWVNPKAWAMGLSSIAIYVAPETGFYGVTIIAVIYGIINIPCVAAWTILGTQLRHFLNTPKRLTVFNYVMAFLLIASLWPILK